MDLQDKKVLVVGSGKSGIGAVKLLHKAGAVPVLYDSNEKLSAKEIREKAGLSGLEVILGTIPESRKKEFALVAISPGVPIDAPLLSDFKAMPVPIWGEIELAYSFARGRVAAITGTNGKTTTTGILCHVLRSEGKKVLTNRTGANMLNGVISAFVLAADRKGELDIDYACIEVDEFASVQILPLLQPGCVLLTNIFRDQIDRYGEIDTICDRIRTALSEVSEEVLIVNGDDFLSWTLAGKCGRRLVTYGINEKMFDHSSNPKIRESTFCHFCGEKLEYDFFHYGQLGIYRCPGCGWKRPLPDYTAEEVRFEKGRYRFRIGGIPIQSQASGPYNVYNTLSAYAGLKALGAPVHGFRRAVETFDYGNSREGSFQINGAQVILYLAKNPVGFQQKISMMLKDRKPKDIIIQINDGSQDGKDISWL